MYFSRNNFNKQTLGKDNQGMTHLKIYKASFVDGEWTNTEELSFNNDAYSNGHPALNSDNTKLYFKKLPSESRKLQCFFQNILHCFKRILKYQKVDY